MQERSFVPLRRESSLGRILYCYGAASGLKSYVDIFTSWGGGSLLLAGGMSATPGAASAKAKTLLGWEIGKFSPALCRSLGGLDEIEREEKR